MFMYLNIKHFAEMAILLYVSDGPSIRSEMYNLGCNYMISRSCNCVGVHTVPQILRSAFLSKERGDNGLFITLVPNVLQ